MKSTILTTPTTNIEDNHVVDNTKIKESTHDSDMDVFTFYNTKLKTTWKGNLMKVSLFDDVIVEGNTHHKILRMLSK